ncbi:MAG: hypothetical protein LBE47_02300 [Methanomassiliicoccaceae archaeon]|jgi:hypothetical protein|nr:hypothetical protein [Methanomassiliicoccaceae archaeon]
MTDDIEFIPAAIAATAEGSLRSATSAKDANELFSSMLRDITLDCVKAGSWMIGHIKANVRSCDDLLSMSSTTDDGNVRCRCVLTNDIKEYSMTVNVIVYGLERHSVAEILVSNVRRVLGNVDIEVHSEVGCEDPKCKDPLCQDTDHKRIIDIR